jgi:hypothetical protein
MAHAKTVNTTAGEQYDKAKGLYIGGPCGRSKFAYMQGHVHVLDPEAVAKVNLAMSSNDTAGAGNKCGKCKFPRCAEDRQLGQCLHSIGIPSIDDHVHESTDPLKTRFHYGFKPTQSGTARTLSNESISFHKVSGHQRIILEALLHGGHGEGCTHHSVQAPKRN